LIVVDTHVLVWDVEGNTRLGLGGRAQIDRAARVEGLFVSAITPWEIALAVSRNRMALSREVSVWLNAALTLPGLMLAPLSPAIAIDSVSLPGDFHSDPADRIIVATARNLRVPLLTADRAILAYGAAGHVSVIDASL
jgi:PIN domain nuclease of toxin-antitoxin system